MSRVGVTAFQRGQDMPGQREISSLLVVAVVVAVTLLWQPAASESLTCGSPSLCFFYCGDSMLDLTPLARGDQQPMSVIP